MSVAAAIFMLSSVGRGERGSLLRRARERRVLTCAMNWRALASHERVSAKARQASRDTFSAPRHAARRSLSSTPTAWPPTTSRGPITGKAATGTPQASASSCTTPNVSVRLGKTNTSAAARCAASSRPFSRPKNFTAG